MRIEKISEGELNFPAGHHVMAWNGAMSKRIDRPSNRGRLTSHFDTFPNPYAIAFSNLFMTFDGEHTYGDAFRMRMPGFVRVSRSGEYFLLEGSALPPGQIGILSSWRLRLFLDPNAGMMPAIIEYYASEGDQVPQSRAVNQLREVKPGVWLPVQSRIAINVIVRDDPFYGKEIAVRELAVDQDRSTFNEDVAEELFDLEFPMGLNVNDEVRNISYQVGASTQREFLDHLAQKGRSTPEALKRASPSIKNETESQVAVQERRRRIWALILINVGLVVVIAFSVGYRRCRRRAGQTES